MSALKLSLLYTTFPVATETFLQRELRELFADPELQITVHSLWSGQAEWEGHPVRCYGLRQVLSWLGALTYWGLRRPSRVRQLLAALLHAPVANRLNLAENLWGLLAGAGLAYAWRREPPDRVHAVWASMPAMAAWVAGELLQRPWSFGAHAYDLFENGGDALLRDKLAAADFVQTSTELGRQRLLALGAVPERVLLVRRGLNSFPSWRPARPPGTPLRVLSVGRLVEKMGYPEQVEAYRVLKRTGLAFEVRIAGEGPERPWLEKALRAADLSEVRLLGHVPEAEVARLLADWADVFVFSGRVAKSGDRAGFPNALGEAMAQGVPVVATPVGAVREGIQNGETGLLVDGPAALAAAIERLATELALRERLRLGARRWVEEAFDARRNTELLKQRLISKADK